MFYIYNINNNKGHKMQLFSSLSASSQEFITDSLSQGFDYQQILYSVCDGEFLDKTDLTQEEAEDIHSFCEYKIQKCK